MAMITVARVGGLALIIGPALYIASTFVMPGYVINGANASDLNALVDAISESPLLTNLAVVLGGVGLMFMLWGLIVMWQTAQSECALDTFVKFGLISVVLAVVSFLIVQCLNYTTSHVVEHGIGAAAGAEQGENLRAIGLHVQSIAVGARLLGAMSGLMGHVVLGFALARKFRPGGHRSLALMVGISAIVSLIGVVLTEPFNDLFDVLPPMFAVLSIFYLVWWVIIGIGVYRGHFGLRVGVTPEH
jgi:hypothetical protein